MSSSRLVSLCAVVALTSIACDHSEAPRDRADARVDASLDVAAIAALPSDPEVGALRPVPPEATSPSDIDDLAPLPDAVAWWDLWITDEDPPASCPRDQLLTGTGCAGVRCDQVRLACSDRDATTAEVYWSTWISEEAPNNVHLCPFDQFVTDIDCDKKWCDNISIACAETDLDKHDCAWTSYALPGTMIDVADDQAIAGIQCAGPNCEKIRAWVCGT